jgi:hypothetical protein
MNYILIDDFFNEPDMVRQLALSMEYTKSSKKTGWKGYRTTINDDGIKNYIKYKLIKIDKKFENLLIDEIFFHYTLPLQKKYYGARTRSSAQSASLDHSDFIIGVYHTGFYQKGKACQDFSFPDDISAYHFVAWIGSVLYK